jgi:hypothetical protein
VAQRLGRGIALLFHNRGTRRGWVVSSTPRPHFTPGKDRASIVQEAGWAPGPVWTGGKSHPTRIGSPDRPVRSQSLYRLSYTAHKFIVICFGYFHLDNREYCILFHKLENTCFEITVFGDCQVWNYCVQIGIVWFLLKQYSEDVGRCFCSLLYVCNIDTNFANNWWYSTCSGSGENKAVKWAVLVIVNWTLHAC